jgi:hypothetical protein
VRSLAARKDGRRTSAGVDCDPFFAVDIALTPFVSCLHTDEITDAISGGE